MQPPYPGAPAPVGPFCCPRCQAPASAAATPQICGSCQGTFVLRAGPRVDPAAVPPPIDPRLPTIKVRSAGLLLMKSGVIAPDGVLEGTLDPVTGRLPLDQSGVFFGDIISVAVWRSYDIVRLVLMTLIFGPIALGALWLVTLGPALLAVVLPLEALIALGFYQAIAIRRNFVRVTGSARALTIQFDSPMRKRRPFHDELLRRSGISPSAIP